MCLNNRILIRDRCEAHGAVVDCEAVARRRDGARPESTTNTLTLEPERPQNDCMNEPVSEAEVEERVNSESCDFHVIVSLSYASSSSHERKYRVMPTIQTASVINSLLKDGLFGTAVLIHLSVAILWSSSGVCRLSTADESCVLSIRSMDLCAIMQKPDTHDSQLVTIG